MISEHEIEITGLTEKASSARSQANSIQSQLEIIQYVYTTGLKQMSLKNYYFKLELSS